MLLAYWLERAPNVDSSAKITTNFSFPSPKVAQISWDPATNAITPDTQLPGWVFSSKLVAKPDQLIKRRGKAGLLALNQTWDEAKAWITARAGKPQKASDFFFVRSTFVSAFRVFGDTGRDTTNCMTSVNFGVLLLCRLIDVINVPRCAIPGR